MNDAPPEPEAPKPSPPPSAAPARPVPRGRVLPWLLVPLLAAAVAADAWMQLTSALVIPAPTTVDLPLGQGFNGQLAVMDRLGLFDNDRQRFYLSWYARLNHDARLIKAGEYALNPGLTPLDLLGLLKSGKVVLHEVRLIEGWRFAQAWKVISDNTNLQHTLSGPEQVLHSLGGGEELEGRFFPDTYRFPKNTPDISILRQSSAAMQKLLLAEWIGRDENLPYTSPEQALTMASIVEKETAVPAERAEVAGVFVRRLRMGMRLMTDPSVIYGMGESYEGKIHSHDLLTDTPYNTYTREGLPPTPICLPGRESIHAAMHPDSGQALYFVSRGDGTHQFSATLEEHNAAVRRYQLGGRSP